MVLTLIYVALTNNICLLLNENWLAETITINTSFHIKQWLDFSNFCVTFTAGDHLIYRFLGTIYQDCGLVDLEIFLEMRTFILIEE